MTGGCTVTFILVHDPEIEKAYAGAAAEEDEDDEEEDDEEDEEGDELNISWDWKGFIVAVKLKGFENGIRKLQRFATE